MHILPGHGVKNLINLEAGWWAPPAPDIIQNLLLIDSPPIVETSSTHSIVGSTAEFEALASTFRGAWDISGFGLVDGEDYTIEFSAQVFNTSDVAVSRRIAVRDNSVSSMGGSFVLNSDINTVNHVRVLTFTYAAARPWLGFLSYVATVGDTIVITKFDIS